MENNYNHLHQCQIRVHKQSVGFHYLISPIMWVHIQPTRENVSFWQKWQFGYCCPSIHGTSSGPSVIYSHHLKFHWKFSTHTNWIKMRGVKRPLSDSSPSQSCLCAWAQWEDGKGLPGCSVSYPPCHRYAAPVLGGLEKEKNKSLVIVGSEVKTVI